MDKEIFREINHHIRNTEIKYLSISTSFIGLVTLIISLLYTKKNNFDFFSHDATNILINILFALIGCIVFIQQTWYRVWKEHYMDICKNIVEKWDIEESKIPYWCRKGTVTRSPSFDNMLSYFTTLITGSIFLLLAFNLKQLIENDFFQILLIIGLMLIYIIIFFTIDKFITKDRCLRA